MISIAFVVAGCGENAFHTSPNLTGETGTAIHYHPVYPYFGQDRSLYTSVDRY